MKITLAPQRRDDTLTLSKSGDILTVNGEDFDFSGVADGTDLARDAVACEWLASDVVRQDGDLLLSLILPHRADAPEEILYPAPLIVLDDGPIALPSTSREATVSGAATG